MVGESEAIAARAASFIATTIAAVASFLEAIAARAASSQKNTEKERKKRTTQKKREKKDKTLQKNHTIGAFKNHHNRGACSSAF